MANDDLVKNVSDTALWVAVFRAQESARPDAVFKDPLAAVLAGERGHSIAASMPNSALTSWGLVTRTSIIDRFVNTLVKEGVDTILNLGAGLDTRPYRLNLPPELRWIEADFPNMIDYKNEKLAAEKPRCRLERVALDLNDNQLRQAFLRKVNQESRALAVITEGVLIYLSNQQVTDLANDLKACTNLRCWIHDCYTRRTLEKIRRRNKFELKSAPFQFSPTKGWLEFFADLGWSVKDRVSMGEEGERIHRNNLIPLRFRIMLKLLPGARKVFLKSGSCVMLQRV